MPTQLSTIRTLVRKELRAENDGSTANPDTFWTDDELLSLMVKGCSDLWRAFIDLHRNHFAVIDATNVSMPASSSMLQGVPADCFRILSVEPRDLSSANSARFVRFQPAAYQSPTFQDARSRDATDPTNGGVVFYDIVNAGSPVMAPEILVAPQLTSSIDVRLVYVAGLPQLTANSMNPIPGEADHALLAWTIAYARQKEREDGSPDPNWLAIYSTEKQSLLNASNPRQEAEPIVVRGIWDDCYPDSWPW